MRLLSLEWEKVTELESLWRDLHMPPETATVMLMLKLLAMKRLNSSIGDLLDTYGNFENHKFSKIENKNLLIFLEIFFRKPDARRQFCS